VLFCYTGVDRQDSQLYTDNIQQWRQAQHEFMFTVSTTRPAPPSFRTTHTVLFGLWLFTPKSPTMSSPVLSADYIITSQPGRSNFS